MEVYEQNEAFVEEDGDLVFSYTKIILRENDQFYFAKTYSRYYSTSEIDPGKLDPVPIPASRIWPVFESHFTRAPQPLPRPCYIKRHSLLYYSDSKASTEMSTLLLNEVEICEILKASPHPNVARYLRCIVDRSRITGLCFAKYNMNLFERVQRSRPFDTDFIMQGIESGVEHLHSLGLVHYDLNPANILMDEETPVIGDFDSCRREGEELGFKAGTEGWTNEDFKLAKHENDQYGLSKIREFLLGVESL